MNQRQLNRAVATATGESVGVIRRHGFSIVQAPLDDVEDRCDEIGAGEEVRVESGHKAVLSSAQHLGDRLPAA